MFYLSCESVLACVKVETDLNRVSRTLLGHVQLARPSHTPHPRPHVLEVFARISAEANLGGQRKNLSQCEVVRL